MAEDGVACACVGGSRAWCDVVAWRADVNCGEVALRGVCGGVERCASECGLHISALTWGLSVGQLSGELSVAFGASHVWVLGRWVTVAY